MIFDVPRITESQKTALDPIASQVIFNIDLKRYESYNGSFWTPFTLGDISGEATGFPMGVDGEVDRTSSQISFDSGSRTFSISPASSSYKYYYRGAEHIETGTKSISIPNLSGSYYIYFNESGTLSYDTTFSLTIIYTKVYIAYLYWNSESNDLVIFGDERHGCIMDSHTHARIHQESGSIFISGGALDSLTIDGNGSSPAHESFSISEAKIRDEDILHVLTAKSTSNPIPVLFRQGTLWRKLSPPIEGSTYPRCLGNATNGSGVISYNSFSAGSWSRTPLSNNQLVLYHVLATNDKNNPFFLLMGTNVYSTKPEAKAAAVTEIGAITGLPFEEFVFVASVLYKHQSQASNAHGAEIVSVDTGVPYIDWRYKLTLNPTTASTSSHNNLPGLQGGLGGNYYHSNQPINSTDSPTFVNLILTGDLTVQGNTTTIDTTNVVVEDKNIELGKVAVPSDTTADGGGITLKGTTDKTFNWVDSTDSWTSSENLDLLTGKTYKINGSDVLTSSQVLGKSMPTGTVVGTSDEQTLTNKTLTSPVVSIIKTPVSGGFCNVIIPSASQDLTLVAKDTNDILTNKTINGLFNSITNVPVRSISNGLTTVNLSNTNTVLDLNTYTTTGIRIQNPAQITFSNGTPGTWYTVVIESDGNYSFTSELRFPLDNAQPVVSANGKIDIYSIYCVSSTKYLATFAFQYTDVF